MGLVEDHKAHATKVAGCLICEARKDWGDSPRIDEAGMVQPVKVATRKRGHVIEAPGLAIMVTTAPKARKAPRPAVAGDHDSKDDVVIDGAYGTPPIANAPHGPMKDVTPPAAIPATVPAPKAKRSKAVVVVEPTPVVYTSREAWMIAAVEALTPWYVEVGHEVPPVRVSIGWPGGRSDATVLGSCWAKESVKDGKAMIFVSPVQDDPVEVLETIAHELIHAINHAWGHGAEFKKVAKAIGIENGGVCKTNRAESPALYARLDTIAAALGTFPHSAIGTRTGAGTITGTFVDPKTGKRINPRNGKPVQGTRMLKVVCPEDGYTVRTTARWIAVGNPACPEGHEMVVVQNER